MGNIDPRWWNTSYLQDLQNDIDDYIGNNADIVSEIEWDFQHDGNHYQNLMLKNNQEGNEGLIEENLMELVQFIEFLLIHLSAKKGFLERPYNDVIRALTNLIIAKDIYERYVCKQKEQGAQHGKDNTLPR